MNNLTIKIKFNLIEANIYNNYALIMIALIALQSIIELTLDYLLIIPYTLCSSS